MHQQLGSEPRSAPDDHDRYQGQVCSCRFWYKCGTCADKIPRSLSQHSKMPSLLSMTICHSIRPRCNREK
jgi:hypothetical protein